MRYGTVGLAVALAIMTTVGCSSSNGGGTGASGGTSATGGTVGTGGVPATGGSGGSAGGSGTGGTANGGSSGTSVTTLSGSQAVNALSTTQATQLCTDTYAYFGKTISMATICKWRGLFYGSQSSPPSQSVLQQKCGQQETSCNQGGDPWAANHGCNDIPTTCTATVTDYATCIKDQVAAFIQTVDGMPDCTALMTSDESKVTDAQINANPPASCASLMSNCQDLTPPSPFDPL